VLNQRLGPDRGVRRRGGIAVLRAGFSPSCSLAGTGVLFPNQNGSPMGLGNPLNRSILPALNRCGICGKPKEECHKGFGKEKNKAPDHEFQRDKMLPEWRGWHAARRGLRTNLYRLGIPEKTIQAILRHLNLGAAVVGLEPTTYGL
jgi:hypothetical protein